MFECHITIGLGDKDIGARVAADLHWTTSEIERDPILGKASYFYLTTHDTDLQRMFTRMNQAAATLRGNAVVVIREKIEVIIHDTKKSYAPKGLLDDLEDLVRREVKRMHKFSNSHATVSTDVLTELLAQHGRVVAPS